QASAETLGRLKTRRAVVPIIEALKLEKNFNNRTSYCTALGLIGERSAIPTLKAKLEIGGEVEFVKSSAALALARLGDPSGRAHLIQTMDAPQAALQVIALTGLSQLNDPETAGYLSAALESRYDEVWTTAVYLFPRLGP